MRGYLEYYNHNHAKMKRLITLSGPVGGFYCGRKSLCVFIHLPEALNDWMEEMVYTDFIQDLVGPTGYWRDPYQLDNYEENCKVLP